MENGKDNQDSLWQKRHHRRNSIVPCSHDDYFGLYFEHKGKSMEDHTPGVKKTTYIKDHKRLPWTVMSPKLDKLGDIDKFAHKRVGHEEIGHLNRLIMNEEIKSVLKILYQVNKPGGFTDESLKIFKDDSTATYCKLFLKNKIQPPPKPSKPQTKKYFQVPLWRKH